MTSPEVPTVAWIPPGGDEIPLSVAGLDATGYIAMRGVTGLGLPNISIVADPMPRGGTRVRHRQPQPRSLVLPVYMEAPDHGTLITRYRALADSFEATRRLGAGQLVSIRPDGSRRVIDVEYQEGFDTDPDLGVLQETVAVTLYAADPFWRDPDPTLITRTFGAVGTANFLAPLINVASSQTLGATTVHNPGGIEAWPAWRIVGPASSVTATNTTTGESWTMDALSFRGTALVAGEEVTITTEPAVVLGPASGPQGTNWSGSLNWVVANAPGAILWGLDPGDNAVAFTVNGAGTGTLIEATFYARYGTA